RLAFARWLSSPQNPLTARVAANHIWVRHFGSGIVPTVFDFGQNGRPPSHPALLDWLAAELIEPSVTDKPPTPTLSPERRGSSAGDPAAQLSLPLPSEVRGPSADRAGQPSKPWSMKHLHRLIVTSATYRMASTPNPANLAVDPDNRFLWRMNSRR